MRDHLADVKVDDRGEAVIATIHGDIDGSNAIELGAALVAGMPAGASVMIMDIDGVEYLDSAGIELLFKLSRRLVDRGQELLLAVAAESPLRRVLEICDVGSVAGIEDDAEAAASRIAAGDR